MILFGEWLSVRNMKSNEIYFETLAAALNSFIAQTIDKGAEFVNAMEIAEKFNGGVSYGQTVSRSFELASLKGKATRKWAQCVIYRMESGRYELVSYIA